jgi:hypothetical protein
MSAKLFLLIVILAIFVFCAPQLGTASQGAKEDMIKIERKTSEKAYFFGVTVVRETSKATVRGNVALRRPGPLKRLRGHVDIDLITEQGIKYSWHKINLIPSGKYGKLSRPQLTAKRFTFTLPVDQEVIKNGTIITLRYHECTSSWRSCL